MRYCADTWFILALFDRDIRAKKLFEDLERSKDRIIVSYVAYAETVKKLFQRGNSEATVKQFFELLENTSKMHFIALDAAIAKEAAKVSLVFRVPLMDACIAATGKVMQCNVLLSGDSDFALLEKKKYIKVQSW